MYDCKGLVFVVNTEPVSVCGVVEPLGIMTPRAVAINLHKQHTLKELAPSFTSGAICLSPEHEVNTTLHAESLLGIYTGTRN